MSAIKLTTQERLFLKRVALRLVDTGKTEPTPEDIAEAMRYTVARDEEIWHRFLELEADAKRWGEESPGRLLAEAIYRRIRDNDPAPTLTTT